MANATKSHFKSLAGSPRYRLVIRSWGLDKTGKNHFGFTGPSPIFGQYFDPGGTEGVADRFIAGEFGAPKEIKGVQYRFKKSEMDQEAAIALRDQFIEDYEEALGSARVVQWDETEVWELFRWAEFNSESDAPRNYNILNARYRTLLQAAYDSGVSLQLIQKMKEKWSTNAKGSPMPTGVYEPMGFKEANYIVQVNLEHLWDHEQGFGVRVANCRQNMTLSGETFWGLDFPTLGQLVFPNSDESDWA